MMKSINATQAVSIVAFAFLAAPAMADEAGKFEYENACASCHGADAKGKGPIAEMMTVVVPPLTNLAASNDGVFPMQKIIAIIDGRTDVRAHGSGMPVWGEVFQDETAGMVSGQSPDLLARGRILSLAYYLESIQE